VFGKERREIEVGKVGREGEEKIAELMRRKKSNG